MSKKFSNDDIPLSRDLLDRSTLKDEVNIESLIYRQIERCYESALQDEALFAANVRMLLSSIPDHKRSELLEKSDEYTSVNQKYQYRYCCGVPMGTPQKPVGNSPVLVEEEIIDWHKLFEMILAALEECRVTWQYEMMTLEAGAVEKPLPSPTPVFDTKFKSPFENQDAQASTSTQAPEKYARPCAICGQHVAPKTGKFYKHKLVHIDPCLPIAETKWIDDPT